MVTLKWFPTMEMLYKYLILNGGFEKRKGFVTHRVRDTEGSKHARAMSKSATRGLIFLFRFYDPHFLSRF